MARLELTVDLRGRPQDLDVLLGAVGPEHEGELPGARVALDRVAPDAARLIIAGDQPAPVRAATNATLRWVRVVQDVLDATAPVSEEASP